MSAAGVRGRWLPALKATAVVLLVTLVPIIPATAPAQADPGSITLAASETSVEVESAQLPKRPMIAPKSRQVNTQTAQRIKGRAVDLANRKVRIEVKLYGKSRAGAKKKLLTWHTLKRVRTDDKGRYSFVFKTGGKRWWLRVWAPGDVYYRPTYARRVQTGFYSG